MIRDGEEEDKFMLTLKDENGLVEIYTQLIDIRDLI